MMEKMAMRIKGYHFRLIAIGRQHRLVDYSAFVMLSMTKSQKNMGQSPRLNC